MKEEIVKKTVKEEIVKKKVKEEIVKKTVNEGSKKNRRIDSRGFIWRKVNRNFSPSITSAAILPLLFGLHPSAFTDYSRVHYPLEKNAASFLYLNLISADYSFG